MNDNELVQPTNPSGSMPGGRSSPYELLITQSKKLGRGATGAFHEVRDLLYHDVPLPTAAERLLQGARQLGHVRNKKQKELDAAEQLKRMVRRSHEKLAEAHTVFLLQLFPDSIEVDRTKISITKRDFFWTSSAISLQIEDILNVSCSLGPLFGSLTIASRVMSTVDHFTISNLWRKDALFIKHLIQGHIIAKNNKLQTDDLSKIEMVETLCELGGAAR